MKGKNYYNQFLVHDKNYISILLFDNQQNSCFFILVKTLKFCIFIANYQLVTMKTKNYKVSYKSSDLTSVLVARFDKSLNLAPNKVH